MYELLFCWIYTTPLSSSIKYPAVHPNDVVVYLYEKDIPKGYEKLGLVRLQGQLIESILIEDARKKAGAMGANGLYYKGFEHGYYARQWDADTLVVQQVNRDVMIAIRTN